MLDPFFCCLCCKLCSCYFASHVALYSNSVCAVLGCLLKHQEVLEREFNEAEETGDNEGQDGGNGDGDALAAEREIEEAVFMSSFIPRSLFEVRRPFFSVFFSCDGRVTFNLWHPTSPFVFL